jgi:hypothetical protein
MKKTLTTPRTLGALQHGFFQAALRCYRQRRKEAVATSLVQTNALLFSQLRPKIQIIGPS